MLKNKIQSLSLPAWRLSDGQGEFSTFAAVPTQIKNYNSNFKAASYVTKTFPAPVINIFPYCVIVGRYLMIN
jgi:hypothetical protein